MKTKHKLLSKAAAVFVTICMLFTLTPLSAFAFNPDWYKTQIKSVSIGAPITDLNGKKYLPVTVNFTAEEDISDENAVYFLEGYLKATLKDGTTAEGISGLGMTLMGPLKPDALADAGSNAFSWEWKPGEGLEMGSGEGVLKYNIPLLEDGETQAVEKSPYTGQQEVNALQEGDKVAFQIETVMNTNTIPADILPEGGSLMSDDFVVVIEDSSQYPKEITTVADECKHDGELAYINQGSKGHDIKCKKCNEIIGSESHSFTRHLTGYFSKGDHHAFLGTEYNISLGDYGEADVCAKCNAATNFVDSNACKHDGKKIYGSQGDKKHNIICKECKKVIGEEEHVFIRMTDTFYFENSETHKLEPKYGEADVCTKCGEYTNFVEKVKPDLSGAKALIEDLKKYTADEAKLIELELNGEKLDKDTYTVTVQEGTGDNLGKLIVDFEPVEGKSTGKKQVIVDAACQHDGELAYINQGSKGHDIKCKKCNEIIGSESHSFTRHLTGYFSKGDHHAFLGTEYNISLGDYGEADVCAKCNAATNFVDPNACKHDGELAYINQGSKGHDIKCKKCNEIIGSESHSFTRHLTGYFSKGDHHAFLGTEYNISLGDYGEADVCAKCNAATNFVAAKDLTKATPAVDEGKSYTQDEAKKITLKDEKGETVDKNSYTVSVEQSKTDENKWVVIFEPVSGKSTGKKAIEVKKACEHDGELAYAASNATQHYIQCKKCEEKIGYENHSFTRHLTGYFSPDKCFYHGENKDPANYDDVYGEADVCAKCNYATNFVDPNACKHDGELAYVASNATQHYIQCKKCEEKIGYENHSFTRHLTGYFSPDKCFYHGENEDPANYDDVYGEADVCAKCNHATNFKEIAKYSFIEGAGQVWNKLMKLAEFRVDCNYESFTGNVEVDGKQLTRDKDFTDKSGSTIITLTSDYLQTLTAGKHTIKVYFEDGYAETEFTVEDTSSHIASDDVLEKWSAKDYQDKTGTSANAEITAKGDDQYEITLTDDSGKVLDTYTINPDTGVGTDTAGNEVNLPQTGISDNRWVWISLAALMCIMGFGLVRKSRKEGEE